MGCECAADRHSAGMTLGACLTCCAAARAQIGTIIQYLLIMGSMYIVGALLYAARIPERFYPGKFDYLVRGVWRVACGSPAGILLCTEVVTPVRVLFPPPSPRPPVAPVAPPAVEPSDFPHPRLLCSCRALPGRPWAVRSPKLATLLALRPMLATVPVAQGVSGRGSD